jgi:hypothetical protein
LYARGTDKKAFDQLPPDDKEPYVHLLRSEVNRAATIAATRVQMDKEANSATRKLAQELMGTLAKIDKLTTWFPPDDPTLIAANLTRVLKALPPEKSVVPAVISIIESIRLLRAWHAQGFELVPPLPNNVDLLGQHFVKAMMDFHEHHTRKKPPASRSSDFAHLLGAAWDDLKFPMPYGQAKNDPEELAAYLGFKIERAINRSRKTKT